MKSGLKKPVYADVAEWQTHKTQNLAGATSCGFKSHHPHPMARNGTAMVQVLRLFASYLEIQDLLLNSLGVNLTDIDEIKE